MVSPSVPFGAKAWSGGVEFGEEPWHTRGWVVDIGEKGSRSCSNDRVLPRKSKRDKRTCPLEMMSCFHEAVGMEDGERTKST